MLYGFAGSAQDLPGSRVAHQHRRACLSVGPRKVPGPNHPGPDHILSVMKILCKLRRVSNCYSTLAFVDILGRMVNQLSLELPIATEVWPEVTSSPRSGFMDIPRHCEITPLDTEMRRGRSTTQLDLSGPKLGASFHWQGTRLARALGANVRKFPARNFLTVDIN